MVRQRTYRCTSICISTVTVTVLLGLSLSLQCLTHLIWTTAVRHVNHRKGGTGKPFSGHIRMRWGTSCSAKQTAWQIWKSPLLHSMPIWQEVEAVVRKALCKSAPGSNGVHYKIYKRWPKVLQSLNGLYVQGVEEAEQRVHHHGAQFDGYHPVHADLSPERRGKDILLSHEKQCH